MQNNKAGLPHIVKQSQGLFGSVFRLLLEGGADSIGACLGVTGTNGYLLGGAIAVAGMICAVLNVALNSFDMLFALAGGASLIFHHPILLSVF